MASATDLIAPGMDDRRGTDGAAARGATNGDNRGDDVNDGGAAGAA